VTAEALLVPALVSTILLAAALTTTWSAVVEAAAENPTDVGTLTAVADSTVTKPLTFSVRSPPVDTWNVAGKDSMVIGIVIAVLAATATDTDL
jgi:hypothetical protein